MQLDISEFDEKCNICIFAYFDDNIEGVKFDESYELSNCCN
ncbi:7229_t:CDS:2 [Funneliformis mosseae]|uniref:7229_t:CDS:1 n=1 Tax=Funneliformis mosseae TaxID=27381 RepID=A0A9N9BWE6_FUNMO|nr:7229_t:CDS:2 [Funneliformis mosseae]